MTAVTFFDAWFVGTLGTEALASLALVFPFQALMQMMAGGAIGGGITSAVARAKGSGNLTSAKKIAFNGLLIGMFMSLFYTIILGVFSVQILGLLTDSKDVINGAVKYAKVGFGGAVVTWLFFSLASILRGLGDTYTPAKAIVIAGFLQIIMSGLFTLGFGDFVNFGIAGPAAAMIICHTLAACFLLSKIIGPNSLLKLQNCVFDWSAICKILKVGGPGLLNSITIALTIVVITSFVADFGVDALAGYGLGSRLELMLVPISFGIGAALTTAVGTNIGAIQYNRARSIAKLGAAITFSLTSVLGLIVAIMPWIWIDLFLVSGTAVLFASSYLIVVGPFYGFFAGGMTLYFASQGTGSMIFPVLTNVIRLVIVSIICLLVLVFQLDIKWLFSGISVGLLVTGAGQFLCLYSSPWKQPL
jgi:putative MATE family efflux protein